MSSYKILISKILTADQREQADKAGIRYEECSALHYELLPFSPPPANVNQPNTCWMITSQNALPALDYLLEKNIRPPQMASTAPVVYNALIKRGVQVDFFAETAEKLAKKVVENAPECVFHLCGEHRRPEAADIFKKNNLEYIPWEVYKTTQVFPKDYNWEGIDAMIVLSPRALEAILVSSPSFELPIGCLGETSKKAALNAGFKHIFTASSPEINTLIHEFHQYLDHGIQK